ncbi:hypothetical protein BC829DRAFT_421667, partial [Chytridium lagenaria]
TLASSPNLIQNGLLAPSWLAPRFSNKTPAGEDPQVLERSVFVVFLSIQLPTALHYYKSSSAPIPSIPATHFLLPRASVQHSPHTLPPGRRPSLTESTSSVPSLPESHALRAFYLSSPTPDPDAPPPHINAQNQRQNGQPRDPRHNTRFGPSTRLPHPYQRAPLEVKPWFKNEVRRQCSRLQEIQGYAWETDKEFYNGYEIARRQVLDAITERARSKRLAHRRRLAAPDSLRSSLNWTAASVDTAISREQNGTTGPFLPDNDDIQSVIDEILSVGSSPELPINNPDQNNTTI